MYTATLRKVGGSVMLAVPPALLDLMSLDAGATVGLDVESGSLVVRPRKKPVYTLDELLAKCNPKGRTRQDRRWIDLAPVGREL